MADQKQTEGSQMHSNKLQTVKMAQIVKFGSNPNTWAMHQIRAFVRDADAAGIADNTKVEIGSSMLGVVMTAKETTEVEIEVEGRVVPKAQKNVEAAEAVEADEAVVAATPGPR